MNQTFVGVATWKFPGLVASEFQNIEDVLNQRLRALLPELVDGMVRRADDMINLFSGHPVRALLTSAAGDNYYSVLMLPKEYCINEKQRLLMVDAIHDPTSTTLRDRVTKQLAHAKLEHISVTGTRNEMVIHLTPGAPAGLRMDAGDDRSMFACMDVQFNHHPPDAVMETNIQDAHIKIHVQTYANYRADSPLDNEPASMQTFSHVMRIYVGRHICAIGIPTWIAQSCATTSYYSITDDALCRCLWPQISAPVGPLARVRFVDAVPM